jgi:hypothetical protein
MKEEMPRNGNPKKVAKKVIAQITKGELPNVKKAMLEVGYSPITANSKAKRVTSNEAYKKEMVSFTDELDLIISDAIDNLKNKKDSATYRDSVQAIKDLTKTQRLINGESTENIANNISGLLDSLEE